MAIADKRREGWQGRRELRKVADERRIQSKPPPIPEGMIQSFARVTTRFAFAPMRS